MDKGIQTLRWDDVRDTVKLLQPELGTLIDNLNPDKSFRLYKVSYPFGSPIVHQGLFHVPLADGSIVPINSDRVDKQIKMDLAYAEQGLPAGLILKNAYELFIETPQHLLPTIIAKQGDIFALWKQLDTTPSFHPIKIFNVTAGARSIFLLPNIGDHLYHKNLKRDFNVHHQPPKNLLEQWQVFKTIAEHEKSSWCVEMLLIPGSWLEKAKKDPSWHEFYLFLLEKAWRSSGYERNQVFYEFALSCAQANRNLKPNPYLLDTVRHLLSITLGATPGFKVATDELLGPIKLFQEAYVNSYGLTKYVPTIFHPDHFNINDPNAASVYYSLQHPTTISFSPRSRKQSSTLSDLRELRYIMKVFIEEIAMNKIHLDDTIVGKIPQTVDYEYFHSKADQHKEIDLTTNMTNSDSELTYAFSKQKKAEYAHNGTFIRGCVRIKLAR